MGARGKGCVRRGVVPTPVAAKSTDELPRVLCFALSAGERSAVLRVLRGYGRERSRALLAALGLEPEDFREAPGEDGGARGK